MFHCNGWTFTWAVTAAGGTHVCLRKVDPALIYPLIREHGVTHLCGAPIVLNLLVHAPARREATLPHTDRRARPAAPRRPAPSSRPWRAWASTSPISTA